VLASVSLLMLGMLFSYSFVNQRFREVSESYSVDGTTWNEAITEATNRTRISSGFLSTDSELATRLSRINAITSELSEASEVRSSWAEILSAIDQALPRDPRMVDENGNLALVADPEKIPYEDRQEIFFTEMETRFYDDVNTWANEILIAFRDQTGGDVAAAVEAKAKAKTRRRGSATLATEYPIAGPGWVIQLRGHHFFNSEEQVRQSRHELKFVKDTLLDTMLNGTIVLTNAAGQPEEYKFEDIGIYYPTVVWEKRAELVNIPNPKFGRQGRERDDPNNPAGDPPAGDDATGQESPPAEGAETPPAEGAETPPAGGAETPPPADGTAPPNGDAPATQTPGSTATVEFFQARKYEFVLQMAFIPTSAAQRDANKAERLKREAEEAAAAGSGEAPANAAPAAPGTPPVENQPPETAAPAVPGQAPPPGGETPAGNETAPANPDPNAPAADPGQPGSEPAPPAGDAGDSGKNPADNPGDTGGGDAGKPPEDAGGAGGDAGDGSGQS
jgi:type IV pilus assembly protein PilM